MRLKLALALAVVACLLLTGLRPATLPFIPGTGFSDAVVSHYPAALIIARSGIDTPWQDLNFAGQPFAANPLNKTAYPPQLLAQVLPPMTHLQVMIVGHVFLALVTMWCWARTLGLSTAASAIASLAYALSPRLVGHTAAGHLDLLYALAWFPWVMSATHQLFSHSFDVRRVILLSLPAAMLVLADVRLALFALVTAGAYAVVLVMQQRRWSRLWVGILVSAIAAALTAGLWLPLISWGPYLSRASLSVADASTFSLSPGALVGLLIAPPATAVETQTFVGIAVLGLACIAIAVEPRRHGLWLGLMAFAALYALGTYGPLWMPLAEAVPLLRWFRVPARSWFIIALVLPLLSGYGAELLLSQAESSVARRLLRPAVMASFALVLCGIFTLLSLPFLAQSGVRLVAIAGGLAVLLMLRASGRLAQGAAVSLLLALVFVDLAWNAWSWLEWRGPDAWRAPYSQIAEALRRDNPDRIYSPAYSLPQQVAADYDLRLFGGVDPFQVRGIAQAIEQASGVGSQGYSVVQPPLVGGEGDDLNSTNRSAIPDAAQLAQWQVSHVAAPYPLALPRLRLLERIGDVYIYRNDDYRLTLPLEQQPRWPNAPDLPDAATVQHLTHLTTAAQQITRFPLLVLLITAVYLEFRNSRARTAPKAFRTET